MIGLYFRETLVSTNFSMSKWSMLSQSICSHFLWMAALHCAKPSYSWKLLVPRKLNRCTVSECVLSIKVVRMCSIFSTPLLNAPSVMSVSCSELRARVDLTIWSAWMSSLPEYCCPKVTASSCFGCDSMKCESRIFSVLLSFMSCVKSMSSSSTFLKSYPRARAAAGMLTDGSTCVSTSR